MAPLSFSWPFSAQELALSDLPVWFDCDTGIDDSLALAQLVSRPEVDLLGVSTVSGNTTAARAARNTLDLLALLGRGDIPVTEGAHHPLAGQYGGGAPQVHGVNGVGEVELPTATRAPEPGTGAQALVAAARARPGELHLVAVGPLTNLALALELAPELPDLVRRVTVMGGAVWVPGNITPLAEANIGNDAEAAHAVFTAGWPLTLVPLDVTMTHVLAAPDVAALRARGTQVHTALAGMLAFYLDFYAAASGRAACPLHDPLATMLATGAVSGSTVRPTGIAVELAAGPQRGRTVAVEPDPGHPVVDVVTAVQDPVGPRLAEALLGLESARP